MQTIAVGDVHGNLPALGDMLGQIAGAVSGGDVVVFLGDYVDRGPASRQCVEAILEFQSASPARVVCLRGNHEDWLLATMADYTRHSWLVGMDGWRTIESYDGEAAVALRHAMAAAGPSLADGRHSLPYGAFFDAMPDSHRAFFRQLRWAYACRDGICVHAGVRPGATGARDEPAWEYLWGDPGFPTSYRGTEWVVYGHWNNAVLDRHGWPQPRVVGRTVGIDTIAHGVLTAVSLTSGEVFQTRRHLIERPPPYAGSP